MKRLNAVHGTCLFEFVFASSLGVLLTGCPSLSSLVNNANLNYGSISAQSGNGNPSAGPIARGGPVGGLLARVCQPDDVVAAWITQVPTDASMTIDVGGKVFKCVDPALKNEHEYQNALNCSADELSNQDLSNGFSGTQGQISVESKDAAGNAYQARANLIFPPVGALTIRTYAEGNACGTSKVQGIYQQGFDLDSGTPVADTAGDIYLSMTQDSYGISSVTLNAPGGMKILTDTRMCDVDSADMSSGTVTETTIYDGGSLLYSGGTQTIAAYAPPFSDWRNTTFLIRTRSGRVAKLTQFQSSIDIPQINATALSCWSPSKSGCDDSSQKCETLNYLGGYGFKFAWFFADSSGSFTH